MDEGHLRQLLEHQGGEELDLLESRIHPLNEPGDKLWDELEERTRILCLDPQLLPRPHPLQSAKVIRGLNLILKKYIS